MKTVYGVLGLCAAAVLAGGCASTGPQRPLDLGCIASRDTTVAGQSRTRALGPFYEHRRDDKGRTFTAVRPFYSRIEDPEKDRALTEMLWPLGVAHRFRRETYWRFVNLYHDDFDNTDRASRYRTVLFPLLFYGRDKWGEDYFAVFPLGGSLHEYIGQDRMDFILFPLYGHAEHDEIEGFNVLWPFVNWTEGEGISRFRVFPFYGRSTMGDVWEKRFYLWPFYSSADFYYPQSSGHAFILFPLFGRVDLTDQQGWMLLPPFFHWSKGEEMTKLNCPWPFIQYRSGHEDRLYIWPFYGRRERGPVRSTYYLWPIVHDNVFTGSRVTKRRLHVIPLYYQEDWRARDGTESLVKARKIWPLFCYARERDHSVLRIPDLWPFYGVGGVERNFAPFWTLYSRAQFGETIEHELLWGLYRTRNDGRGNGRMSIFPLYSSRRSAEGEGVREWSLLHGLLGYRREGWQTTYRLLYFFRIRHGEARPPSPGEE